MFQPRCDFVAARAVSAAKIYFSQNYIEKPRIAFNFKQILAILGVFGCVEKKDRTLLLSPHGGPERAESEGSEWATPPTEKSKINKACVTMRIWLSETGPFAPKHFTFA